MTDLDERLRDYGRRWREAQPPAPPPAPPPTSDGGRGSATRRRAVGAALAACVGLVLAVVSIDDDPRRVTTVSGPAATTTTDPAAAGPAASSTVPAGPVTGRIVRPGEDPCAGSPPFAPSWLPPGFDPALRPGPFEQGEPRELYDASFHFRSADGRRVELYHGNSWRLRVTPRADLEVLGHPASLGVVGDGGDWIVEFASAAQPASGCDYWGLAGVGLGAEEVRAVAAGLVAASSTPEVAGLPPCRGDQLSYQPGGPRFLRFFNTGAPCALAGHPTLWGLDATGRSVQVPAYPLPGDPGVGSPWTGRFAPDDTAIIVLSPFPPDAWPTRCPYGDTPIQQFNALRLELPAGGGTIDLPNLVLDSGPCRMAVSQFGFDSTDE